MVRTVVGKLEDKFDHLPEQLKSKPGVGTEWKTSALSSTLQEIPRIGITGTETGTTPGFGEHIYSSTDNVDPSKTVICMNCIDSYLALTS
jgi:hypothetical protein